ncbi:MAG TPA: hypothetical protein VGQ83_40000 [Polyangia bacterium]|jgi:hypothetical protein
MSTRLRPLLPLLLVVATTALGCGSEDEIRVTIVKAGDGDPLAAATSVEVTIQPEDPTAAALARATFPVGGGGTLSGKIPYGTAVHVIARGLAANGDVVARGGSRELLAPAASGTPLELQVYLAASGTFYTTFEAQGRGKTGPDSGLPGLSATRLSDGQVLVAGGTEVDTTGNITGISKTAYLYDPDTGVYRKLLAQLQNPRAYHSATPLRGRPSSVLLCGGLTLVNNQIVSAATCEVFDPVAESFAIVATPMAKPRVGHGAVLLPDTRVLLTGGADVAKVSMPCSGACSRDDLVLQTVHNTAEVYNPDTHSLAALTKPMAAKRAFHSALRANRNGRVLLAGGEDETGTTLGTSEIFTPDSDTFATGLPLDTPRTRLAAVRLPNDDVCLFGGLSDGQTPSSVVGTYECFSIGDLGNGTKTPSQPTFASRRDQCAVALSSGTVLLVGGFDASSSALATAELISPGGAPVSAGVPAAARALHACAGLGTGGSTGWEGVIVVGGVDARGGLWTGQPSGEIYTP